jgi:hypothetical protein
MGDRSPKSKQRDQKKKDQAKARSAAAARSKEEKLGRSPQTPAKGKK